MHPDGCNSLCDSWLRHSSQRRLNLMVGVVGIEPTHVGVKVRCLTTWLHPNIFKLRYYIKPGEKSKLFWCFFCFPYATTRENNSIKIHTMMKLLGLLMKRPTDKQVRYAKIIIWVLLIIIWIVAFNLQNLTLEDSLFGIALSSDAKIYISYTIMAIWAIPIVLGWLDINVLSRGRTRILQIAFGITLFIISGMFVDTATLSVDIFYFIIGLIVFIAGVTGKAITKKGLKAGQKITKIRV